MNVPPYCPDDLKPEFPELKQACDAISREKWAEEEAEKDLKFAGDAALAKLPISETERAALRGGLIHYARNAASRTVSMLKFHNYLTID